MRCSCTDGMDVGTAKLTVAERRGIPHHQLDVLDVTETATVARYRNPRCRRRGHPGPRRGARHRRRLDDVRAVAARRVGFPATDPQIRAHWESVLAEGGLPRCVPSSNGSIRKQRPPSCRPTVGAWWRALEVVELTGKPFAASAPKIGEPRWGTMIFGVAATHRRTRRTDPAAYRADVRPGSRRRVERLVGWACGRG